MDKMKLYTHEEMLDKIVGQQGSPRRDALEAELHSYLIGEAIKQARKDKNLTRRIDGGETISGFTYRKRTQPDNRNSSEGIQSHGHTGRIFFWKFVFLVMLIMS